MRRVELIPRLGLLAVLAAATGALVAGLLLPIVGGVGVAARSGSNYFTNQSTALCQPSLAQRSRILDANGDVIAKFYNVTATSGYRIDVPLSKVPQIMQNALIAVEDVRFYEDNGIDLKGSLRALAANGSAGDVQQGGSTLTQQYVKNVLLQCHGESATEDTLSRKIKEAAIALHLAQTESKAEILQGYLNIVYFGDNAYGIGAAARVYFGESVSKLTLTQSALLAGLVQAPSVYDPANPRDRKLATERRNIVLAQMLKYHFITQRQFDSSVNKPLGLHIKQFVNGCTSTKYPWFCAYVENVITSEIGTNELLKGGLTVQTTLNPKIEDAAEAALRHYVPPKNSSKVAAAEAVVQPGTGHVEAIAVSSQYGNDAKKGQTVINYAVPEADGGSPYGVVVGSTAKLFTLTAALKEGLPLSTSFFSPYQISNLGPYSTCSGDSAGYYSLHNAGASDSGNFNMVSGTWFSINTFYAQLELKTGLCEPAKIATSMGVTQSNGDAFSQLPSSVLGDQHPSGLTPLAMANAYATIAAHGRSCPDVAVTSITDAEGNPVKLPTQQCTQVLAPQLADTVTSILEGVLTQPGATAASVGDPGRPAAGKTGTANNDSVSNFAGYVPQLASFVWVGHPLHPTATLDRLNLGGIQYGEVFGATLAGPIWKETFETALEGQPVESLPSQPSAAYVKGKQTQVPDVSGISPMQASETLKQDGFDPVISPTEAFSLLPAGTVAGTSPGSGANEPPGATIVIYVSNGKPPKPSKSSSPPTPPTHQSTPATQTSTPTTTSSSPAATSSTPVPPPANSPPAGHHKNGRRR